MFTHIIDFLVTFARQAGAWLYEVCAPVVKAACSELAHLLVLGVKELVAYFNGHRSANRVYKRNAYGEFIA